MIKSYSEPCNIKALWAYKNKKTYHITQNAVRADSRAAFLRDGTGRRQLVRLGIAQADGETGLGVSVYQQDLLPGLSQPDA